MCLCVCAGVGWGGREWVGGGCYLKNALVHLCLSADDKLDILDA